MGYPFCLTQMALENGWKETESGSMVDRMQPCFGKGLSLLVWTVRVTQSGAQRHGFAQKRGKACHLLGYRPDIILNPESFWQRESLLQVPPAWSR